MLIHAEEKRTFFERKKGVDCGVVSVGQLLGPNGYLTYMNLKHTFRRLTLTIRYLGVYWLQLRITKGNWV